MHERGGHRDRSLLWRDVQSQLGVSDTAIVVFADRHGCWGVLDLWRYDGGSFTTGELRLLATLARPVTAGLRAAIARTFADPGRHLYPIGPAVVVLGPDLHVRSQTEAAADALLRLNPPDEPIVVSEHTASDHLKAILTKTGARTRQLLLARGLGTR